MVGLLWRMTFLSLSWLPETTAAKKGLKLPLLGCYNNHSTYCQHQNIHILNNLYWPKNSIKIMWILLKEDLISRFTHLTWNFYERYKTFRCKISKKCSIILACKTLLNNLYGMIWSLDWLKLDLTLSHQNRIRVFSPSPSPSPSL